MTNSLFRIAPRFASTTLIYLTGFVIILCFCNITLPSNLSNEIEIHTDLAQPVRHQVIHHKGVLLNPIFNGNCRSLVTLHMADGDRLFFKIIICVQAVNPFPSFRFYAQLSPIRLSCKLKRISACCFHRHDRKTAILSIQP